MVREEFAFAIACVLGACALVFSMMRLGSRPLGYKAGRRDPDESWLAAANQSFKSLAGFGMLVPMVVVAGLPALMCRLTLGTIPPGVWPPSLGAAAAIPFFGGFVAAMIHRQRALLMRDTPTHSVAEAPQGHTELQGRAVRCSEPLRSAVTGTPCIWWRLRSDLIRRPRHDPEFPDLHPSLPELITEDSSALIALEDDSGRCHLWLEGAEVSMPQTIIRYGFEPHPRRATYAKQGLWAHLFGRYRYTETLIQEGQAIFAHGELVSDQRLDQEPALQDLQSSGGPVSKLMRKPQNSERPFAITFRSEQQLQDHHRRQGRRLLFYTFTYAGLVAYLGWRWVMA